MTLANLNDYTEYVNLWALRDCKTIAELESLPVGKIKITYDDKSVRIVDVGERNREWGETIEFTVDSTTMDSASVQINPGDYTAAHTSTTSGPMYVPPPRHIIEKFDRNWAKHHNYKCAVDYLEDDSEWNIKESEMKTHGVYKLIGLNRRTGAFIDKGPVFGPLDEKERVLQSALLKYADEIKTLLGGPHEELQFQLDGIMSYEPIEEESD